jgi:hypothetical protein
VTFDELKELASRFQPSNVVEEAFVGFLHFEISEVERIRRAAAARREQHILDSVRRHGEFGEALDLGRRLLSPACWTLYGLDIGLPAEGTDAVAESGPNYNYPPPGPLVEKMETTEAGCRLLLEHWTRIYDCLRGKGNWIHKNVFDIMRLMGKRPLDSLEDQEAAVVFMAAHAIDRGPDNAFMRLKSEMGFARAKDFLSRVKELASKRLDLGNPEQGRATIVAIIEPAMKRLSEKAEEHRLRASGDEAREAAGREFDSSPLAAKLEREEKKWIRAASRTVNFLVKARRDFGPETSESGGGKTGRRAQGMLESTMRLEQERE